MKITNQHQAIEVQTDVYILRLDKPSGRCTVTNPAQRVYTSFPLALRADSAQQVDDSSPTRVDYVCEDNVVRCVHTFADGLWATKTLCLTFFEESIELQGEIVAPVARPLARLVYCRGIFEDKITSIYGRYVFVPTTSAYMMRSDHPDNHYKALGENLIEGNYFEPPPLNVSVTSDAGYMNVGACRLPPSKRFGIIENGILTEEPANLISAAAQEPYAVTPIVFTFSESPWDGLDTYRRHLVAREYVALAAAADVAARPDWWLRPTLCTFGEMMTQGIKKDSERFNSDWVREFILGAERDFALKGMTLILDDKWARFQNDPEPDPDRFGALRKLIDWCHARGSKVILWWILRDVEEGALAQEMGVMGPSGTNKAGIVDATLPRFEDYVRRCMRKMLGSGPDELDADGLKVDGIGTLGYSQVRHPDRGIGWQELHRFFEVLYRTAKEIKPDASISGSSPCPHFMDVQDVVRLHDLGWDWRTIREERARVALAADPLALLDSDVDPMMDRKSMLYHYAMAAVYSVPSVYFLNLSQAGIPIPMETKRIIGSFLRLSMARRPGWAVMDDYGRWRWEDDSGVLAETIPAGIGLVVYRDPEQQALVTTAEAVDIALPLRGRKIDCIEDDAGRPIAFAVTGMAAVFRTSGSGRIDTMHLAV